MRGMTPKRELDPGLSPVRTPMVRRGALRFKSERTQHAGTVKYRMVLAKVLAALEEGRIGPKTVLAEVTAGSTGVALALVGQRMGFSVELHTHANAEPRKMEKIRRLGAALVVHPTDVPVPRLIGEVVGKARAGTHWHLNQFDRDTNIEAYLDLAGETVGQILADGAPPPSRFVCPVGTGGLIQGVGTRLREAFPGIAIVAVEPEPGATIDGIRNTDRLYMGEADPYDRDFPDLRVEVPVPDGNASVEGIPLGESASACLNLIEREEWEDTLLIAAD